jgi:N-dimethylarginine dimethylaminohydrolase
MGHGHRSSIEARGISARWLDVEVLPLRSSTSGSYHLDTCFCPLEGGFLLYYPPAFDQASLDLIHEHIPRSHRIAVEETRRAASLRATPSTSAGSSCSTRRAWRSVFQLERLGFDVVQNELTEFMKAGGSAKCLTLRLDERRPRSYVPVLAATLSARR